MQQRRAGYAHALTIRGVPIYVHWSLPIGALWVAPFSGYEVTLMPYLFLGYLLVISLHEGGHVAAARMIGLKVYAVEISGTGGLCRIERPRRVVHSAIVFSAGVVAQLALLVVALIYVTISGMPTDPLARSLVFTLMIFNAVLAVINLIPAKALSGLHTDGYVLWKLLLHVVNGGEHPLPNWDVLPVEKSPIFAPETSLLSMPALVPNGFTHGVEILNDATTPMLFVIETLERHLQLTRNQAIGLMVDVHNRGGKLWPIATLEGAELAAAAIAADAKNNGHRLVCRAVTALRME